MQIELSVRIKLDEAEYFRATDRTLGTTRTIEVHRISMTKAGDSSYFCHGPKVLKRGEVSRAKNSFVLLKAEALPIPLLEKIQAALAPHLAAQEPTGSEAARQAVLG